MRGHNAHFTDTEHMELMYDSSSGRDNCVSCTRSPQTLSHTHQGTPYASTHPPTPMHIQKMHTHNTHICTQTHTHTVAPTKKTRTCAEIHDPPALQLCCAQEKHVHKRTVKKKQFPHHTEGTHALQVRPGNTPLSRWCITRPRTWSLRLCVVSFTALFPSSTVWNKGVQATLQSSPDTHETPFVCVCHVLCLRATFCAFCTHQHWLKPSLATLFHRHHLLVASRWSPRSIFRRRSRSATDFASRSYMDTRILTATCCQASSSLCQSQLLI